MPLSEALAISQEALLGIYQIKKHYYLQPLYETLFVLLLCIPILFLKDGMPDHHLQKASFITNAIIPLLFILLARRIYKVIKLPKLFVFDFNSKSLVIDNAYYSFKDLKYFYVVEKEGSIKVELELPSPKVFEAGYSLKTLSIYKIDSSLKSFSDSIKHIENIKIFSSE